METEKITKNQRVNRRTSINGTRNVLNVKGKEPGFVYRIVNDEPGRVDDFKERGYEVVIDKNIQVGDKRVATPAAEGTPLKIHTGGGHYAYVMRIREEWYEEDQAAKQEAITQTEHTIKQGAGADYGKVEIQRK